MLTEAASITRADETAAVIQHDAADLPLADGAVDLVVTSPPYFALRSYRDGGEHYDGQLGSEATPQEFVDNLVACTAEWVRVLRPSGSIWVNLGDKYSSRIVYRDSSHQGGLSPDREDSTLGKSWVENREQGRVRMPNDNIINGQAIREKSLMGLPWRYALACIDQLGLILRAEVIWSKPNGLPESVTDRVRRSHEQWFHFTVEPRYFSAVDEIREEHKYQNDVDRPRKGYANGDGPYVGGNTSGGNPLGRLPGSVWTVPTEPLQVPDELGVDHFAAFPQEWPRRIIQGWSPNGVCVACGEGRRPVVSKVASHGRTDECDCPTPDAPTQPAVVLDPFGGTGTTAGVARALGRFGISNDMSSDYNRLAVWRIWESGHFQKAEQRMWADRQETLL